MERIKKFFALSLVGIVLLSAACAADGGQSAQVNIPCADLVTAAIESIDFPLYETTADAQKLTETYGTDASLTEDFTVAYQLLSVDLAEIIVVKAKDKNAEELKEQLEARKEYLKNTLAFYPDTVAAAEAAVVSSDGNYVWLVCHKDAQTASDAIRSAISAAKAQS